MAEDVCPHLCTKATPPLLGGPGESSPRLTSRVAALYGGLGFKWSGA